MLPFSLSATNRGHRLLGNYDFVVFEDSPACVSDRTKAKRDGIAVDLVNFPDAFQRPGPVLILGHGKVPHFNLFAENAHNIWLRGSIQHCRVDNSGPDLSRGFKSHIRISTADRVYGERHADRLRDIWSNREFELVARERSDQLVLIGLVINPSFAESPLIESDIDDVRHIVFHNHFRPTIVYLADYANRMNLR